MCEVINGRDEVLTEIKQTCISLMLSTGAEGWWDPLDLMFDFTDR